MLSNSEVEEYKQMIDKYNKAVASEQAMQEQLSLLKKQAQEILAKYGLKKLSDINQLKTKLEEMETEIKESQEAMIAYIEAINSKKEEKSRILIS